MNKHVLAPYACRLSCSRGRFIAEEESQTRSDYQRDRDRIIHSSAFRRLAHKTQVFVYHEGDHYRTRLTHSLEVSQIARSITRSLGGDEDLAEALALAHDLGHTPFGHVGEEALDGSMANFGGFDHNAQSVRIVTRLEKRYAAFDGLNLTWETLEGLVKHNGPLTGPNSRQRISEGQLPHAIAVVARDIDLHLDKFTSLEAQISAISDDIAYNNHDIDDGIRAGLFDLDDLRSIDLVRDIILEVERLEGASDSTRKVHEMMRRLMSAMVDDVTRQARKSLEKLRAACADDIRAASAPIVTFSTEFSSQIEVLRDFLFNHMYFHDEVRETREIAGLIVVKLFDLYMNRLELLPTEWRAGLTSGETESTARRVADFIAGMTDRFAVRQHNTWFAPISNFG